VVVPGEHQTEVQHSMQERILESSRFPEISFTSETIQPIGESAWNVSANLQLHGQTRVIHLSVHKVEGRYIGANDQTDRL
jgi:polyisoprenoid-binding protein YceI